ncbi:MAG: hypothetical protein EHM67_13845, partial [Hyphomicrobiaceae bacterium]
SHATYRNHGSHVEAVEVIFEPARVSYRQILEFFLQIHDPSTRNRQGDDVGTSYDWPIQASSAFQVGHPFENLRRGLPGLPSGGGGARRENSANSRRSRSLHVVGVNVFNTLCLAHALQPVAVRIS